MSRFLKMETVPYNLKRELIVLADDFNPNYETLLSESYNITRRTCNLKFNYTKLVSDNYIKFEKIMQSYSKYELLALKIFVVNYVCMIEKRDFDCVNENDMFNEWGRIINSYNGIHIIIEFLNCDVRFFTRRINTELLNTFLYKNYRLMFTKKMRTIKRGKNLVKVFGKAIRYIHDDYYHIRTVSKYIIDYRIQNEIYNHTTTMYRDKGKRSVIRIKR